MSLVDRNRAKLRCFRHLLETGVTALHFDARRPGVEVPLHLRDDPWLVLNYSYRYNVSDFAFDDAGVTATLSFAGQGHLCFVPWTAVFAITDDARTEGQHWQEDVPTAPKRSEGARRPQPARAVASEDERDALPETANEPPRRHGLQLIDGGRTAPSERPDLAAADEVEGAKQRPAESGAAGHLRRVK